MMKGGCAVAAAVALFGCANAHAACGVSFCAVNTDWAVQGEWTKRGGRVDLRFEYIDQDQPRSGTDKVAVGEVPRHHDEVRTINRNWIATFDYNFSAKWGISAALPVVDRSHEHIHHHHGSQLLETWNFTEAGDARVTGRYRFASWAGGLGAAGVNVGVKLPTGRFEVTNDAGDMAERSLQPGTGTTDGLVGVFYSRGRPTGSSWFAQLRADAAFEERDGYRPGNRLFADVGYRARLWGPLAYDIQVNGVVRDRDSGDQAEPEDTGGEFVYVSPGLSVALGPSAQAYLFLQLPLYQRVNGVQLTADWAFASGVNLRF
jgi:hypothetical protein